MKNYTLLFFLSLISFFTIAQEQAVPFGSGPEGMIKCATVENMARLRSQHPGMQNDAEFEGWIQSKMEEAERDGSANSRMVLTIPIVFHIIHNGNAVGSGLNLSRAQVESQLDVLNEDFRRMAGTSGFNNDSVGADVEIEFCMAYRDTSGMPMLEPGINRIDRNARNWPAPQYTINTMNGTIKPQSIWNPNEYYNVWVTDIGFGGGGAILLGYAQFPSGSTLPGIPFSGGADTDGVVILSSVCGRVGRATGNFDQGRTLVHETGHWLGLRHIWGDGGCGVDDFCSDTPESDASNSGCNPNHVSCGTVDMVRNYMDYSRGTCMNIFTQCQRTRMRTVLQNASRRASLVHSLACQRATTAPASSFAINDARGCEGIVSFVDSSQNFPSSWFWVFGDGTTSTLRNPTHAYAASGTYNVNLIVNNSFGTSSFSQQVTVSLSPASTVDAGPDIKACAGDQVTLNVNVSDPQATFRWSPTNGLLNPTTQNPTYIAISGNTYYVTATDSTGCSVTDTLNIAVVVKPLLSLGNDITIQPGATANLSATLSKPAMQWRWTPVYGFTNTGDDTLSNPIVMPGQTVTYDMTATDVDGCEASKKVTITVEGTPPLAIDGEFENEVGLINLPYPNPAKRELMFSADFNTTGELELSLFDLNGKKVETLHKGNVSQGMFVKKWQRDQMISSGLYFVEWRMAGKRMVQKVQLK